MCDSDGKPDFKALMEGAAGDLCAWCFDSVGAQRPRSEAERSIERKAMLRVACSTRRTITCFASQSRFPTP